MSLTEDSQEIMKKFHGVYKNKTVLVTGHTGFQGSWLTLWLKLLGAKIVGYSIDVPTNPSMFKLLNLEKKIIHIKGDIKDLNKLESTIRENKPEFVFHFAAQPLVRLSYEKPIDTFHTNVLGTANILESIRNSENTKVCIIMTSDKCYETPSDGHPCNEDDKMGGSDPYSASKAAAEIITSSYKRSFFNSEKCGIATTRVGNVIGGGDWAKDRLIPDCIRGILDDANISIRNPQAIRPWQHVLEPLSAILWLSTKMSFKPNKFSQGWNFGPDFSNSNVTVNEVVNQILKEWKFTKSKILIEESALYETDELRLDSTKSLDHLNWKNILSTKEAISETIQWYKEYDSNRENLEKFTSDQILKYVKKAREQKLSWGLSD